MWGPSALPAPSGSILGSRPGPSLACLLSPVLHPPLLGKSWTPLDMALASQLALLFT